MNPQGNYADTANPYWQWSQWPKVLAGCVRWLGEGSDKKVAPREVARQVDKTKPTAEDLAMEAFDLSTKDFTAKLREARVNMVDAESARVLLATAVDNADKIEDMQLLEDVVRRAAPFFDQKFAPLGEKLMKADMPFLREAGYQILGLAGDPKYRTLLEKGLSEERVEVVRQALTGLARLGDAASRPTIETYLAKGSERLLAVTALRRTGAPDALKRSLPVYAETLTKRIHLRCGRRSIFEDLYGGVSFKLTPAQRRRLEADYRDILQAETNVKNDIAFFMDSMRNLPDQDLAIVFDFLVQTENRDVLPLAYTVLGPLPKDKAAACKQRLKNAKLPELRMLAAD
jgi:hypothetical protein